MQPVAAFPGLAFQPHHGQFFDVRRFQIMRLNLLGINILPVAEHNQFFLATSKEQVTVGVEVAEIARVEPSVAQHRRGCIRAVPVALHHERPAQCDFARGWAVVFLRSRVVGRENDPGLYALHGFAYRSDDIVVRRICKHRRGCFRQAVGLQHVNAEIVKVLRDLRVEARTSRDQIAHLLAEGFMDLAKQNRTGVNPHLAQCPIDSHQTLKHLLRERPSLLDLLEDALVNQIKELRHHGEGGDIAFAQSSQKLGRVQSFQIHHARTFH